MSRRLLAPVLTIAAASLLLAACGQASTPSAASTAAASTAASAAAVDECSPANLTTITGGQLTIGTDSPAYPPYFVTDDATKENGDPASGQGFESAVAYAVAEGLGFTKDQVKWEVVPFNSSYAPGDKNFDFDINQISITPERAEVVDFSDGYYTVNQAVVALADSPIAGATTIAELQKANLGAQVGTTSATFIDEVVMPENQAQIFNDTNDAKSAMQAGQIDGLVVDLPTAYYITAVEIENSKIVGQFAAQEGGEQFGLLFAKGNPLVTCVNKVLGELKASGELQAIQDQWLAGESAPYIKQ
ncbi:MAG: ABC transporter substrate-binding protein [Candidatus Nanopelagicales bacterium]